MLSHQNLENYEPQLVVNHKPANPKDVVPAVTWMAAKQNARKVIYSKVTFIHSRICFANVNNIRRS